MLLSCLIQLGCRHRLIPVAPLDARQLFQLPSRIFLEHMNPLDEGVLKENEATFR